MKSPDWLVFIVGGSIILGMAVFITPFVLVLGLAYGGYLMYREHPVRQERLMSEKTEMMYRAALNRVKAPVNPLGHIPPDRRDIADALLDEVFLTVPPPPAITNTIEGARYRDLVSRMSASPDIHQVAVAAVTHAVMALPDLPSDGDLEVPSSCLIHDVPSLISEIIFPFFTDEVRGYELFEELRTQLDRNFRSTHASRPVRPEDYQGDDPVHTYLRHTPLADLFDIPATISISERARSEHWHVVAGTGHGKTQLIQWQLSRDIERINSGECSYVVLDNQGGLFKRILECDEIDEDRYVVVDAADVAFPVCLNLFDVNMDRINSYSQLDRERLINSAIELFDFVIGSLLGADLSSKQKVPFRYVMRLMLHIPDATIHTFVNIFRENGLGPYKQYVSLLPQTAQTFFAEEFDGKQFKNTKTEVLRRMYGVLENQAFERMFSHPRNKVDLLAAINEGKVVLIHASKDLLKQDGTEFFGRFFIALIMQAAYERGEGGIPCYVVVDEAQDYFDENVAMILEQARKFGVSFMAAHQYLDQLSPKLQSSFSANTSIKMAGGVSAKDARTLSQQMNCDPPLLQKAPKGTFGTFIKGQTDMAVPLDIPFFALEKLPKRDVGPLVDRNREMYAEPIKPPEKPKEEPPKADSPPEDDQGWGQEET